MQNISGELDFPYFAHSYSGSTFTIRGDGYAVIHSWLTEHVGLEKRRRSYIELLHFNEIMEVRRNEVTGTFYP